MAVLAEQFSSWLKPKLEELNIDETVFGAYIVGVLDDEASTEEKIDGINDILSGILPIDTQEMSKDIVLHWEKFQAEIEANSRTTNFVDSHEIDEKLVKLMESQAITKTVQRQNNGTEEERRIRQAILAQYSQLSEDEQEYDSDDDTHEAKPEPTNHIERNVNVLATQQAEKERREQAKLESRQKKEKDKEDREKQKQQRDEKKEKRKMQSQKVERKR